MQNLEQLGALVETLESQEKIKKDYLVNGSNLIFHEGNLVMTHADQNVTFKPTSIFHSQIGEKLNIPKGYYDKMKEKAVKLLDDNVNHWLKDEGKNMLIRSFRPEEGDNVARAFLSDRYNMIDNVDVLMQALESIKDSGFKVDIVGAELSETRMYLKVTCPDIEIKATEMLKNYRKTVQVGTGIISGFVLQNSEIGYGSFQISPRAVVLACDNGLVNTSDAMRKVHLGGKLDDLDFHKNDRIKNANRKLVKEQVRHAVAQFLSKDYLQKTINKFTELGQKEIEAPIAGVVEVVAKDYGITQEKKSELLNFFIRGGDTRRIGMANAITELAQTYGDPDQRNDTEAITWDMLKNFNRIEASAIKAEVKAN